MIQRRRGSRGIPLFPLFNQREKLVQFIYHSAPPPEKTDNFLLADWCKSLCVTISHCLPITSFEIDVIRYLIVLSRMNPLQSY